MGTQDYWSAPAGGNLSTIIRPSSVVPCRGPPLRGYPGIIKLRPCLRRSSAFFLERSERLVRAYAYAHVSRQEIVLKELMSPQ